VRRRRRPPGRRCPWLRRTICHDALRRNDVALRWVYLPLLLWVLALAAIPNKWEGYTGPVAAYTAVALTLLLTHTWRVRWSRAVLAVLAAVVTLCAALWVAADLRLLTHPRTPTSRSPGARAKRFRRGSRWRSPCASGSPSPGATRP
jgi:hypothetical protein